VSVRIWFVAIDKFFATPFQLVSSASVDLISSGMSVFHNLCQKSMGARTVSKNHLFIFTKRKVGKEFQVDGL
jgi:hypothetical protein